MWWVSHGGREGGLEGWGSYIFKDKLRRLKEVLKKWNKEVFRDLEQKVSKLREEFDMLDIQDDAEGLSEVEKIIRSEVSAQLLLALENRRSLLAQKAKMRWLKEGDTNSRLFIK